MFSSPAQAEIDATLELCHAGNEPSAGPWQEDLEAVRAGGEERADLHCRRRVSRA